MLDALNEYARTESDKRQKKYLKQNLAGEAKPIIPVNKTILGIGVKVRVILEAPLNAHGKKDYGGFRATDLRWEKAIKTITNILITPRQPVMYQVDNQPTGYTTEQLQVVESNERQPKARAQAEAQAEQPQAQAQQAEAVKETAEQIADAITVEAPAKLKTRSGRAVKRPERFA